VSSTTHLRIVALVLTLGLVGVKYIASHPRSNLVEMKARTFSITSPIEFRTQDTTCSIKIQGLFRGTYNLASSNYNYVLSTHDITFSTSFSGKEIKIGHWSNESPVRIRRETTTPVVDSVSCQLKLGSRDDCNRIRQEIEGFQKLTVTLSHSSTLLLQGWHFQQETTVAFPDKLNLAAIVVKE
jgi:hypothetical protein